MFTGRQVHRKYPFVAFFSHREIIGLPIIEYPRDVYAFGVWITFETERMIWFDHQVRTALAIPPNTRWICRIGHFHPIYNEYIFKITPAKYIGDLPACRRFRQKQFIFSP